MENQYIKQLERIGLTESEASIYLASLALGPASVIEIGQKATLTRQMVYNLIPALVEQGLIKEVRKGQKRHFEAVSPDVLKSRTKKISAEIDELVPELKTRQATNKAIPLITVYENPLAMREWYENFMSEVKRGEEFLVWSSGKDWYEMDKRFIDRFLNIKDQKRLKNYVITAENKETKEAFKIFSKHPVIKSRFVADAWQSKVDKWIWRDEVCILTMRANATNMIVIKSADYAELEKFDFYKIWNELK